MPYHTPEPAQAYASVGQAAVTYGRKQRNMGLLNAVVLSAISHAALCFLVMAIYFVLLFLGFEVPIFKTQMKPRDIEFVLVDTPDQKPRNPTKNRAEHNSRSGGTKIANRPVLQPQTQAGQRTPNPKPRSNPQPRVQPRPTQQQSQNRPQPKVAQAPRPTPKASPSPAPVPHPQPQQAPKAPTPKAPTPVKVATAIPTLPPNPVAPAIKLPSLGNPKPVTTGPIASTSGTSGSRSGGGGSSGSVGPQAIPGGLSRNVGTNGSPGASGGRPGGGSGGRGSFNQSGSPGGGGGRPGIDAQREPDFGPYIAELQRRIKRNWAPPAADRSKRVVTLFTVDRSGRLVSVRIQQSSGTEVADAAAIAAVRNSAPFRPLPAEYRGNTIDVQFIFDYDVWNGAKIR